MRIALGGVRLVEYTEHLLQPVVDTATEQGYLDDDTVVREALYKGVVLLAYNLIAIVVIGIVIDVDDRCLYVVHPMAEQIDGYHRQGVLVGTILHYVFFAAILGTKVLAEPQGLGFQPRLL